MGAAGTPGGATGQVGCLASTVAPLQQDEHDAVDDKGDGHRPRVVEVLVEEVVQRKPDGRRRNAADGHHAPQPPRAALLGRRLSRRERVQLMEVQDEHGHDGAQLDDHQEQLQELRRHVQLHELVHENHVARGRDGQPFGDALHDADEERLQNFDEHVHRNCLRTICLPVGPSGERQPRPERAANTRKSAQGALPLSSLGNAITALRIVRIPTEKVHVCHFGLPRRRPAQRSQRATQPVVSRVPPIPPRLVDIADFMSDTT